MLSRSTGHIINIASVAGPEVSKTSIVSCRYFAICKLGELMRKLQKWIT
ncbi:hypothetical protein [Cytobacillus firmus]|nr:hypothetical protein NAF01_15710 [Cytobacillus firmus]